MPTTVHLELGDLDSFLSQNLDFIIAYLHKKYLFSIAILINLRFFDSLTITHFEQTSTCYGVTMNYLYNNDKTQN